MPSPRVAIAGFMHETNTFAPTRAGMDDFLTGSGHLGLQRGPDLIEAARGINISIAGAIEFGEANGWTLMPGTWAAATPSAHVERAAFETITGWILEDIKSFGALDGIFLDLHGAMVCEHIDDGEGELLERVRALVGPDIPIVVCLDLHGNITQRMVTHADVICGYRTYPHVDMLATGLRGAKVLHALMATKTRPIKAFRRLPYLIPISWQCTSLQPAKRLYDRISEEEAAGGLVDMSFFPGFPAADFPDCGPTVVAYGDRASAAADDLAARILAAEPEFAGKVYTPDEGVRAAMAIAASATKPVVIADTQDNPGAGGDSDTTGMLRALVANGATRAAIGLIVDPASAAAAHAAGLGADVTLALGGKSGIPDDGPFEGTFRVEALSDGQFMATGPYFGSSHMNLGASACLVIGDVRIVVASHKAQLADQAMYRYVGIEPTAQSILVNKSSMHFRADFEPIAAEVLVCAAPGPMAVDPASLPWTRLPKGLRLSPLGPVFE